MPSREWQHPAPVPRPDRTLHDEETELRRRVDDLRDFERDYRARMIAYHEDCLRKLRAAQ